MSSLDQGASRIPEVKRQLPVRYVSGRTRLHPAAAVHDGRVKISVRAMHAGRANTDVCAVRDGRRVKESIRANTFAHARTNVGATGL